MKNKSLQFRKVSQENLDELIELSRTTFYETFSSNNTDDNIQSYLEKSFNKKKLNQELLEKKSEFYFTYYENEIAGYIKINFGNAQKEFKEILGMELERIYILREYQGRGIGKDLLGFVISTAKQKTLRYVWLGVWEENIKAINFYKKYGFEIIESHPFTIGDDLQTDYIMKLKI